MENKPFPFNYLCYECMVQPRDFREVVDAFVEYVNYWDEREFEKVFPHAYQHYMYDERGKDFIRFYCALDNNNRRKIINRIMEVRYLRLEPEHQTDYKNID